VEPYDSIPALGHASLQRLHPAYVRAQIVGHRTFTAIVALVSLMGISVAALVGDEPGWLVALLAGAAAIATTALAVLGEWWVHLTYRHAAYAVSAQGLEIRRGVLWRKIVDVPRSRIQHTDVTQGPLERAFGLATLQLYTAGVEHAKVEVEGLALETALALRLELLQGDAPKIPDQGPPAEAQWPAEATVDAPEPGSGQEPAVASDEHRHD
jgi:uncharacterized protein